MGRYITPKPVFVVQNDPTTNAVAVISYPHKEIHSGNHYFFKRFQLLPASATLELLMRIQNDGTHSHMTIGLEAVESAIEVSYYEDVTIVIPGTAFIPINRNRNSPNVAKTEIRAVGSVSTGGLLLSDGRFGAGKKSEGVGGRDDNENVLMEDVVYAIKVTETGGVATYINWSLDWYEHKDSNS
jgi:hypothetical protein